MNENSSESRLHIAFVIGSMQVGGAQRMTANLIGFLSRLGVRVSLITLDPRPPAFTLPDSVKLLAPVEGRRFRRDIGSGFRVLKFLRKSIKASQAEIVISFLFPALFLLASASCKAKKIISIRNNPNKFEFPDSRSIRRVLFRYADAVLCQTDHAAKLVYKQTRHKNIEVFPNFLDDMFMMDDVIPAFPRAKRIVYVGRLVEGKGTSDLIWAFADAFDKDWELILVGAGPLESQISNYAAELDVADRVIMTGDVNDVRPFLVSAQIFAFCSYSEGFPNALMEAMAQGLCCVSYNCNAGPSELIIDGQNGFLIDVGDKVALKDKLVELSQNPELMMTVAKAAKDVRRRYCQENAGKRFLSFLNRVLER